MPIDDQTRKWFEKYKLAPPSSDSHGTEDEIAQNRTPIKPYKWVLEGNKLIGISEQGTFAQFIPTNYILDGMDENNMPKLREI